MAASSVHAPPCPNVEPPASACVCVCHEAAYLHSLDVTFGAARSAWSLECVLQHFSPVLQYAGVKNPHVKRIEGVTAVPER
eukprot:5493952-Prymnesium_polylepis.1